jgi:hypothetical protein
MFESKKSYIYIYIYIYIYYNIYKVFSVTTFEIITTRNDYRCMFNWSDILVPMARLLLEVLQSWHHHTQR